MESTKFLTSLKILTVTAKNKTNQPTRLRLTQEVTRWLLFVKWHPDAIRSKTVKGRVKNVSKRPQARLSKYEFITSII